MWAGRLVECRGMHNVAASVALYKGFGDRIPLACGRGDKPAGAWQLAGSRPRLRLIREVRFDKDLEEHCLGGAHRSHGI